MRRFTVVRSSDSKSVLESKLIDAVVTGDLEAIKQLRNETIISGLSSNQILMQDLVIEAVGLGNKEILLEIVDLLASDNLYAYEVGEFAVVVSASSRDCQLCLAILNLWVEHLPQDLQRGGRPVEILQGEYLVEVSGPQYCSTSSLHPDIPPVFRQQDFLLEKS